METEFFASLAADPGIVSWFQSRMLPEPNSGCWFWTGAFEVKGYGVFKRKKAHRFAYYLRYGRLPLPPLELHHRCEIKCCVNPDHLVPVTRREHIMLGPLPAINAALQRRKTHCKYGHPFDDANTYWDARGHRNCRACHCRWTMQYEKRAALGVG